GDLKEERLAQARTFGCETINLAEHDNIAEQIEQILGTPMVDAAVDCVGFEAYGHNHEEAPAAVLNQAMEITKAGGGIGIKGINVEQDHCGSEKDAQKGSLKMAFGTGLSKAQSFATG